MSPLAYYSPIPGYHQAVTLLGCIPTSLHVWSYLVPWPISKHTLNQPLPTLLTQLQDASQAKLQRHHSNLTRSSPTSNFNWKASIIQLAPANTAEPVQGRGGRGHCPGWNVGRRAKILEHHALSQPLWCYFCPKAEPRMCLYLLWASPERTETLSWAQIPDRLGGWIG